MNDLAYELNSVLESAEKKLKTINEQQTQRNLRRTNGLQKKYLAT